MDELNKVLLKKIASYDLIICAIFISIGYFFIRTSVLFFLLGSFYAYINLVISSLVVNHLLLEDSGRKKIWSLVSSLFKVLLVCITGVIIITKNDLNFIIYIVGYTSQLISIVLYGLNLGSSERK